MATFINCVAVALEKKKVYKAVVAAREPGKPQRYVTPVELAFREIN